MSRLPGETLKKYFHLFRVIVPYLRLKALKYCKQAFTKIIASSFKLSQLIQDVEWYS